MRVFKQSDTPEGKLRAKFRGSKAWADFKVKMKVKQHGVCAVSGTRLTKTANLHHKDLDIEHYTDISDDRNFVYLSNTAHEVVHWLFRSGLGWRQVLKNLEAVLEDMERINRKGKLDGKVY